MEDVGESLYFLADTDLVNIGRLKLRAAGGEEDLLMKGSTIERVTWILVEKRREGFIDNKVNERSGHQSGASETFPRGPLRTQGSRGQSIGQMFNVC